MSVRRRPVASRSVCNDFLRCGKLQFHAPIEARKVMCVCMYVFVCASMLTRPLTLKRAVRNLFNERREGGREGEGGATLVKTACNDFIWMWY